MRKSFIALLLAIAAASVCSLFAARSGKSSVARNLAIFNALVKELEINYVDTLDADELVRTAIDAMLEQIDPYTEYYPYEETERLTSISTGRYSGIGAYIRRRNGAVMVTEPVWGTPSHTAGLRPGDVFVEIDGTDVSRQGDTEAVSKMLRGDRGTTVHVKVRRPYVADSLLSFDIVRGNIDINPLPYWGIDSTGIGYVNLNTFNEHSASLVKDAVQHMLQDPALKGLAIDLRDNGGGILEGAVQIASLFVPKGTEIVRTRGFGDKNLKIYKTTSAPLDTAVPLAILINGNTASASEILSGSLQDLDRAVVIGTRSYGKGLVQTSRPLPYDGLMKVTVARYYIPSGRLIQAIDYSHRNPDGSAARIPDSLTRVWHTAHGRQVRDGGGISPDVTVTDSSMNRLIYNVIADDWAFDFANRHRALHPHIAPADTWAVDDSLFAAFKASIDPVKFKYDRATEQGIDYLRQAARTEGYWSDAVAAQLDSLATLLHHNLERDLDYNRPELERVLDGEISQRYYNEGDRIKRALRYDADLDSARSILLDAPRYHKILSPQ